MGNEVKEMAHAREKISIGCNSRISHSSFIKQHVTKHALITWQWSNVKGKSKNVKLLLNQSTS